MKEAEIKLSEIIDKTHFETSSTPIYQCVDGLAHTNISEIKENLKKHITHSVLWSNMVRNMKHDNFNEYYEVGTDDTLQKIVARMYPDVRVYSIWDIPSYKDYKINYSK